MVSYRSTVCSHWIRSQCSTQRGGQQHRGWPRYTSPCGHWDARTQSGPVGRNHEAGQKRNCLQNRRLNHETTLRKSGTHKRLLPFPGIWLKHFYYFRRSQAKNGNSIPPPPLLPTPSSIVFSSHNFQVAALFSIHILIVEILPLKFLWCITESPTPLCVSYFMNYPLIGINARVLSTFFFV